MIITRGKYKRLTLSIDNNGNVIVKAPKFYSDKQIISFIESKQNWLKKKLDFLKQMADIKQKYNFNNFCYVNNKAFKCDYNKRKTFYINQFETYIKPLVQEISIKTGLNYNNISYIVSKRVWGSLNKNNDMKLNLSIIILPKDITKYIIVHELCHSREFNHSQKFWKLVQENCIQYKNLRKELKYYDFLLREEVF